MIQLIVADRPIDQASADRFIAEFGPERGKVLAELAHGIASQGATATDDKKLILENLADFMIHGLKEGKLCRGQSS